MEEEEEERAGRGAAWEREGRPGRVAAGLRHLVWEKGLEWKCRRCGREANTEQRRRAMRSSRCLGSAVGRLLAKTCADPEAVARSCVERKIDMEGRGWRPKGGVEGGECSSTGVQYLFGEEEDELGSLTGQEEGDVGELGGPGASEEDGGEMAVETGGREGGAAAAPAAAALAGGSGSATAVAVAATAQRERLPAVVPFGGPLAGHSDLQAPPQEVPELPEEEVRAVIVELGGNVDECLAHETGSAVGDAGRKRPRTEGIASRERWTPAMPITSATSTGTGWKAASASRGVKRAPDRDEDDEPRRRAREGLNLGDPAARRQRQQGDQSGGSARLASDEGNQRGSKRRLQQVDASHADDGGRHAGLAGGRASDDEDEAGASGPGGQAAGGLEREGRPHGEEKRRRPPMSEGGRSTTRVQGRRYTGVVSDPVDTEGAQGHSLFITGPIIWCDRCGRYATRRVRQSLKNKCVGLATGAYPTRLARLRAGRHPMTGEPIIT